LPISPVTIGFDVDIHTMRRNRTTQDMRESERKQAAPEPMTGAQASSLKRLADEVHEPSAFAQNLSKREASRRIEALSERLRLCELPPHTD
jgi:hypothetical protein